MIERHRMIEAAEEVATRAHDGQMYGEKPYIVHPLEVACLARELGYPIETVVACILHDVVEDSNITLEDLLEMGFPRFVVDSVEAATYTEEDHQNEVNKAKKARRHIGGWVVKFCDASRNLQMALNDTETDLLKRIERIHRYIGYLAVLSEGLPKPESIKAEIRRYYLEDAAASGSNAAISLSQSSIESS
jgi:(p)ppGpp synthase/HD superfamily hydrolase